MLKRRMKQILSVLGAALFLSGCKLAILNPKGVIAADETRLLIETTLIMLIVVVPSILLTLLFAWRYSAKKDRGKYTPDWSHSTLLEAIWWGVPCAIIAVLATITWISSHHLDPYQPVQSKAKPITIEVVALNWKWLFIYPKQKIATVNFVQFPAKVPVEFLVTSDAPMNSFQIVQLAGQIYAMAGMQTKLHLIADEPGDYKGLSTSFSGDGFADMKFIARVSTQQQFDQWVEKVKRSPKTLSMAEYKQLVKDSRNNPVAYYSTAANKLFHKIIMKYMPPKPMLSKKQITEKNHA